MYHTIYYIQIPSYIIIIQLEGLMSCSVSDCWRIIFSRFLGYIPTAGVDYIYATTGQP